MAKKSSKKTFELKMLVPEENKPDTGTRYYVRKPTKGEKRSMKIRVRNPILLVSLQISRQ